MYGVENLSDKAVFTATVSKQTNCLCNACHDCGRVTKITYPETMYYDGQNLTMKTKEMWLCNKCRQKLTDELLKVDVSYGSRCRRLDAELAEEEAALRKRARNG